MRVYINLAMQKPNTLNPINQGVDFQAAPLRVCCSAAVVVAAVRIRRPPQASVSSELPSDDRRSFKLRSMQIGPIRRRFASPTRMAPRFRQHYAAYSQTFLASQNQRNSKIFTETKIKSMLQATGWGFLRGCKFSVLARDGSSVKEIFQEDIK